MTECPENIEVYVGYDNDDIETDRLVPYLHRDFKDIDLHMVDFARMPNMHTYFNLMYRMSCGEYLLTLNDDAEILTPGWDEIARKKINEFDKSHQDQIFYGMTEDLLLSHRHGQYCCFPIISRKVCEVLGYLQSEEFIMGGADIFIGNIMHAIERVIDMKDIIIDHISFHNYPEIEKDHVYHDSMKRFSKLGWVQKRKTNEVCNEVDALRKYISIARHNRG